VGLIPFFMAYIYERIIPFVENRLSAQQGRKGKKMFENIDEKIEEYLLLGMKISFGLLVLGQTVNGIMSLL